MQEFVFFLAGLSFLIFVFQRFIGYRFFEMLIRVARIEDDAAAKFMLFIYTVSSSSLVLIFYWIGWESESGQRFYYRYLRKLVAKDYYREHKRLNIDGALGSLSKIERRGLDADEDKKDAVLDGMRETSFTVYFTAEDLILPEDRTDGERLRYYDNGNIKLVANYKAGKLDGLYRTYYEDGILHQEKFYKGGALEGLYRAFDEHGVLYFEISYQGGKQHGPDKIYNKYGVLAFCDTYDHGIRINRKTYDERGKVLFSQDFDLPSAPADG